MLFHIASCAFHACLHGVIVCDHSLEDDVIFLTVLYNVVAHELFSAVHAQVPGTFPCSIDISAKKVNRVVATFGAEIR